MRNKDKRYHYLYKTTNMLNNKYYYGIHSTNNLNDGYLGSGKKLRYSIRKYGKENFKREILYYFDNREELAKAEENIITEEMLRDKMCMNITPGGEIWNTLGMVVVKDKNDKCFKIFKDDPRYLSGELQHPIKNMVYVKDKYGNTSMVRKTDTHYLSGEFLPLWKNFIMVKDKDGNCFRIIKDDPRYLSGELTDIWTGRKHSEETKEKMSKKAKERTGNKNSQFGTCWITKDGQNKKIKKEDLQSYINSGWIKGRKIN